MSAIWLGAVEPLVFRPTVEAVCPDGCICTMFSDTGGFRIADLCCPVGHGDGPWDTRTVPPVVPSFDEPCPDCVEPLVFRPTRVREYADIELGGEWLPWGDGLGISWEESLRVCPELIRERTVPPVVPSFDEPCPDCDGAGSSWTHTPWFSVDCPTCNGTGTVQRVWRAEWQKRDTEGCRHCGKIWLHGTCQDTPSRRALCAKTIGGTTLAVVSWYPVTVLPVVNARTSTNDRPQVYCYASGIVSMEEEHVSHNVTAEPWAADLELGCVVVMPGNEVRLDTPITTMMCPKCGDGSGFLANDDGTIGVCDCEDAGRVPLSLVDGINDVELAQ